MTNPLISTGKFILECALGHVDGILISMKEDNKEMRELVKSLGHKIKKEFLQTRDKKTPYYVGKGKIEEIKRYVEENGIEIAFVNDSLRPSQWFNLENYLGIEIYDRIRVILEIFAKRARRKEAKLQVKLAKLSYEKAFVKELFHRVKEEERPGFLSGGEYVVADYYEMIKRQIKKIKKELKKIEEEREDRRGERKERGFYLVSIAGYTNAGKSSLLNYLTGEDVVVDEMVFSTLSTKTSKLKIDSKFPILFTDTVGFIKDLPHWIIDAFHSTLEEIALADVIVLIVDGSEEIKEKINTSLREIYNLRERANIIIALNKIDLIGKRETFEKVREIREITNYKCIPISVKNGTNIELLLNEIYNLLPPPRKIEIKIPIEKSNGILKWLNSNTTILNLEMKDFARIGVLCSERLKDKVIGKCLKLGGKVRVYGNGR